MFRPRKELPITFLCAAIFRMLFFLMVLHVTADEVSADTNSAHTNNDWQENVYEEHKIRQIVLEIKKNEMEAAVESYYRLDALSNYSLIYSIVKHAYASDPKDTIKIVSFINKLPWCNHQYAGYEFLFNELKFNNHLRKFESIQFAYLLKKFLDGSPDCRHIKDDNDIMTRTKNVKDNLPEGIRNLVWSKSTQFLIKNNELQEYLYSAVCCQYNSHRRRVFTWRTKLPPTPGGKWILEFVNGFVRIKNVDWQKDLYAAASCCIYDDKRRNVFTWIPAEKEVTFQGDWELELVDERNMFTIKSNHFNEYLYAATCCLYDDKRRSVFTWIPKGYVGPRAEWEISPC